MTIATLKVPNFADYTIESAGEIEGITASVKKQFSESAPYGSLISQSLEAGTFITDKEGDTTVKVVYSAGRPYLKSYFGTLEGQLAEDFYNDYKANGANITYTTYSVDSDEEKLRGLLKEQNDILSDISKELRAINKKWFVKNSE